MASAVPPIDSASPAAAARGVLVTDLGQVIRCPVHDIRIAGRGTAGVVVFRLGEGERVVSVASLSEQDDNDDEGEAGGEEGTLPPTEPPPDTTLH